MTRAAIPDPRDEPLRDRETVRLPRSTTEDIDELVDEGKYPNRSAFVRAGARLLIQCEREDVWPEFGRGRSDQSEPAADEGPASLQEIAEADAAGDAEPARAAADGGMVAAVEVESEGEPVAEEESEYEFVAESPAVSEADIVTKLRSVMRDASAVERAAV